MATNQAQLPGVEKLRQLLDEAVAAGADSVELEFASGGGLEVTFFAGNTGCGRVVEDRNWIEDVLEAIYDNARRQKKAGGTMRMRLQDEEYVISVHPYDSFGETAHRLRLKKAKR